MNDLISKLTRSSLTLTAGAAAAALAAFGIASADDHALRVNPNTSCSQSTACVTGSNTGSGIGVYGSATKNYGVFGAGSSTQAAVGGFNSSAGDGVYGQSTSGIGVEGSSSKNYGVRGNGGSSLPAIFGNNSSTGDGVYGYSWFGYGLEGDAPNNYGVRGEGGSNLAAVGGFNSSTGAGVYGQSTSGPGVVGFSPAGYGVWAQTTSTSPALFVQGGTTNETFVTLLVKDSSNNTLLSLKDNGNLTISGVIFTANCHTGCSRTRHVGHYGASTTVPTIDDVGEATLRDGRALVALDPAFANAIDATKPYVVLVTPEGDSNGVYVAGKTQRGFEVRENRGGHATIAFSYRIVAHPLGATNDRLPFVNDPAVVAKPTQKFPRR